MIQNDDNLIQMRGPRAADAGRVLLHCVECGRTWTAEDDPAEYAYGHDCEAES